MEADRSPPYHVNLFAGGFVGDGNGFSGGGRDSLLLGDTAPRFERPPSSSASASMTTSSSSSSYSYSSEAEADRDRDRERGDLTVCSTASTADVDGADICDFLGTFGVRLWHKETQQWVEISARGAALSARTCLASNGNVLQQFGEVPLNRLTDGCIIDLCGGKYLSTLVVSNTVGIK